MQSDSNASRPAPISELGSAMAAMLEHLRRSGVSLMPIAQQEAVQEWRTQFVAANPTPAPPPPKIAAPTAAAATPLPPVPRPRSRLASAPVPHPASAPKLEPYQTEKRKLPDRVTLLAEVAAKVSVCQKCETLACQRKNTVPGEGNPLARVCFLGEAPGADEDATGHPFVGRAGQLLTKMIEACTFKREDVFIFNTIKCRPPGNRTPEHHEVENCRDYLERQLEIIQPEYIVCLGLIAAKALLHTTLSVGRLRGQFHAYRGSKVLVTYHPSYLLREPEVKKAAWADLQFLLRDMGIELPRK